MTGVISMLQHHINPRTEVCSTQLSMKCILLINIKSVRINSTQVSMEFILFINVKIPKTCILTVMSSMNLMFSCVEHEKMKKSFITERPALTG